MFMVPDSLRTLSFALHPLKTFFQYFPPQHSHLLPSCISVQIVWFQTPHSFVGLLTSVCNDPPTSFIKLLVKSHFLFYKTVLDHLQ